MERVDAEISAKFERHNLIICLDRVKLTKRAELRDVAELPLDHQGRMESQDQVRSVKIIFFYA